MAATTAHAPSSVHSSSSLRQATLKNNMSITQTYYLAHKARGKLSREAAQADHDLRLLVGHANLLDSLMVELADAEREQERWFNQSVRASSPKSQDRHVQWVDRIQEEEEEEYEEDSSSDSEDSSDDDFEEEDVEMTAAAPAKSTVYVETEQMEEDDDDEDYAHLQLVRTPSHSSPPPELMEHDSESSEDESMPPSPTQPAIAISELQPAKGKTEQDYDSIHGEDYYLAPRHSATVVTAISVY